MAGGFIAVASLKGGVGKTSLAVTLATFLHARGERVAFLDLDDQRDGSRWIGSAAPDVPVILPAEGSTDRRGATLEAVDRALEAAPWVVADCPPQHAEVARTVFGIADVVVTPTSAAPVELLHAANTLAMVAGEARFRQSPAQTLVILTRTDPRTTLAREADDLAAEFGARLARTRIASRVAWPEAMGEGRSLFTQSRAVEARTEAEAFCAEVLALLA